MNRLERQTQNIMGIIKSEGVLKFISDHVFVYVNGKYIRKVIPFLFHNKEEWVMQKWNINNKEYDVKIFSTNYNEYNSAITAKSAMDKDYSLLKVENKDVVDIGANVGDTAMYFALKGASHVYAIEPYPHMFEIAKKNIEANNLQSKVILLRVGVGSKSGEIKIESNFVGTAGSVLKDFESGEKTPIITLEDLVNQYKINGGVLKMDVEGSEYDILLNAKREVLARFSEVIMEYHYGRTDELTAKLKDAGFKIDLVTTPRYAYNKESENPNLDLGIIHATK